ncbi:SelB C-terminal domain-containing protein, partial [bacterium]|nr:SelB C-terminal domain-containing protein [bacterium]
SEELGPAQNALVQLRLESPLVAERGDLFVVRSYSPVHTVGGGRVIDPSPERHKRMHEDVIESLAVLETGGSEDVLLKIIGDGGMDGVRVKELAGLVDDSVAGEVDGLVAGGDVKKAAGRYITRDQWTELAGSIRAELERFTKRAPLEWGMSAEELRGKLGRGFDRAVLEAALAELGETGDVSRRRDLVRWGSAEMKLTPPQKKMAEIIERFLKEDDVSPPTLVDLRPDVLNELGGSRKDDEFDAMMKLLADDGRIVKVTTTLFFHPDAIRRVRQIIAAHFENETELGVPKFKELVGVTRKSAIPLLEYFDREGTTLRQGSVRVRGRNS